MKLFSKGISRLKQQKNEHMICLSQQSSCGGGGMSHNHGDHNLSTLPLVTSLQIEQCFFVMGYICLKTVIFWSYFDILVKDYKKYILRLLLCVHTVEKH